MNEVNTILLKEKHLNILTSIFDKLCPNATVYAYGSRVKGDAHEGSDLDLAFVNNSSEEVSLAELKFALRESLLPFFVHIFELKTLPESFQKEINKCNVVLYNGGKHE